MKLSYIYPHIVISYLVIFIGLISVSLEYNAEQSFFTELQEKEEEFGITDIQLGLTTLEEVFLNIARQAELETAAAEGRLVPLTLTSGTVLEVSPN